MSRLKELIEQYCPDGVEYKRLRNIATFGGGKTPSKKNPSNYAEDGHNWVTSKDVKTSVLCRTGVTISDEGARGMTMYPKDAIVMVTRSGILQKYLPIAILGEQATVNQDIKVILARDTVLPKYLLFALQSKAAFILSKYHKAGTVDSVDFDSIKVVDIPVPPIEVQREIVRILDSMQELDDALNEELSVRQVQLDYAIETMLSEERINRFEGETVEYSTVKDLRSQVITPVRAKPTDFSGDIPWCKLEDVEGFELRCSLSGKGVSDEVVKSMGLKVYPEGTVLCSCSATLGKYCIVERPLVTNQRFMGFVCKEGVYNRYFMYAVKAGTSALVREATGTTNPYISRSAFESLQIQLPSYAVQLMVSEKLDSVYRYISVLEEELQTRRKQFESYRDKLLDFPEKVA